MGLQSKPIPEDKILSSEEMVLEEYKLIVSERRFIMVRYMQSLIFYPVIFAYAFRELIYAQTVWTTIVVAVFIFFINAAYLYGAINFRSMAYHALNREMILAEHLKVQLPHPMIWGYYAGIVILIVTYIGTVVLILIKVYRPHWLPSTPIQGVGSNLPSIFLGIY
jgi:hypothetical protein